MMQDFKNPKVPFSMEIKNRLVPGTKIIIVGCTAKNCESFGVNLKCGPEDDANIALHMNIRFPPYLSEEYPVVVRNSLTSGLGWGLEERNAYSGQNFPLEPNHDYKIEILCERTRFRIFFNDRIFTVYNYRIPLGEVSRVEIVGDTDLSWVQTQIPNSGFLEKVRQQLLCCTMKIDN